MVCTYAIPYATLRPLNILFLRVSNSLGLLGKIFVFASIELLFLSSVVGTTLQMQMIFKLIFTHYSESLISGVDDLVIVNDCMFF